MLLRATTQGDFHRTMLPPDSNPGSAHLIVTSNCKDALRNEDLRSKCDFQTMRMHQILQFDLKNKDGKIQKKMIELVYVVRQGPRRTNK